VKVGKMRIELNNPCAFCGSDLEAETTEEYDNIHCLNKKCEFS